MSPVKAPCMVGVLAEACTFPLLCYLCRDESSYSIESEILRPWSRERERELRLGEQWQVLLKRRR